MRGMSTFVSVESLVKYLLGLVFLGLMFIFLILPNMSRLNKMDAAIADVRSELAKQSRLAPLYIELAQRSSELAEMNRRVKAYAAEQPGTVQQLTVWIGETAKDAGLTLLGLPIGGAERTSRPVSLRFTVRGEISALREMFFALCAQPAVGRVEEFSLVQEKDALLMEFGLLVADLDQSSFRTDSEELSP